MIRSLFFSLRRIVGLFIHFYLTGNEILQNVRALGESMIPPKKLLHEIKIYCPYLSITGMSGKTFLFVNFLPKNIFVYCENVKKCFLKNCIRYTRLFLLRAIDKDSNMAASVKFI